MEHPCTGDDCFLCHEEIKEGDNGLTRMGRTNALELFKLPG